MSEEIIERSFSVETPARLKLSNIRGKVDISPGDEDQISVTAVVYLNSGNADHTELDIHQDDDGMVVVETRHDKKNSFLSFFKPCKVDYAVTVPKDCSVELSCVSSKPGLSCVDSSVFVASDASRLYVVRRAVSKFVFHVCSFQANCASFK